MVNPERRWLDGIIVGIRKDENGETQDVCLTDMTAEELEETLKKYSSFQKDAIIRHLVLRLRYEGDTHDIRYPKSVYHQ